MDERFKEMTAKMNVLTNEIAFALKTLGKKNVSATGLITYDFGLYKLRDDARDATSKPCD